MLIDCPECSGKVSSEANTCPHCAFQIKGRENLVLCEKCKASVIPVTNPHNSIGRFCPICNTRLTGKGCHLTSVIFFLIIAGVIALIGLLIWGALIK